MAHAPCLALWGGKKSRRASTASVREQKRAGRIAKKRAANATQRGTKGSGGGRERARARGSGRARALCTAQQLQEGRRGACPARGCGCCFSLVLQALRGRHEALQPGKRLGRSTWAPCPCPGGGGGGGAAPPPVASVRPSARPPSPSLCVFGAEERWQRLHFLLHFHPWGGGRRRRGGASTSPPPVAKRLRASAAPPAPPAAGGRGGSLGRGAARASGPGAANFPGGSAPPLGRKAPPPPRALCSSAAEALPPPLPRFLPPRALRIRQCKGSQRRRAGPHPPTSS